MGVPCFKRRPKFKIHLLIKKKKKNVGKNFDWKKRKFINHVTMLEKNIAIEIFGGKQKKITHMGYCPYVCVECFDVEDNGWEETMFDDYSDDELTYHIPMEIYSIDTYATKTICPTCKYDHDGDDGERAKFKRKNCEQIVFVDEDPDCCWACLAYIWELCRCDIPALSDYSTFEECEAANYKKKKRIDDKAYWSRMRKKELKKEQYSRDDYHNMNPKIRTCYDCKKIFDSKKLLNKHLYRTATLPDILLIFTKQMKPSLPTKCAKLINSFLCHPLKQC
jgi:hypothetical protein